MTACWKERDGRRFVRHPAGFALRCRRLSADGERSAPLRDIGRGGLCFTVDEALRPGERVALSLEVLGRTVRLEGEVVWCERGEDGRCEAGVRFLDRESACVARMVEQVCHIEAYRRRVAVAEGRLLSREQAASEWIERHAADFP